MRNWQRGVHSATCKEHQNIRGRSQVGTRRRATLIVDQAYQQLVTMPKMMRVLGGEVSPCPGAIASITCYCRGTTGIAAKRVADTARRSLNAKCVSMKKKHCMPCNTLGIIYSRQSKRNVLVRVRRRYQFKKPSLEEVNSLPITTSGTKPTGDFVQFRILGEAVETRDCCRLTLYFSTLKSPKVLFANATPSRVSGLEDG